MSNAVYPDLPGVKPEQPRIPVFATKIQRSVSGAEARAAFQAYPLRRFALSYEFLRHGAENELRILEGFFLARRGAWDSFLYLHPDDSAATDQALGTGNGTLTQFQIKRTYGYGADATFAEPVHNVAAITAVKLAGTPTVDYTVNATGLITFTSPVPSGQAVTWSGTFYYRCRFERDDMEFTRFLQDLYQAKKVELIGSPMNKI